MQARNFQDPEVHISTLLKSGPGRGARIEFFLTHRHRVAMLSLARRAIERIRHRRKQIGRIN